MKNLNLFLLAIFFVLSALLFNLANANSKAVFAASKPTYYARVMTENVFLYRNAINNEDFSNIYFEIPRTYFVELIDDYNTDFYLARYLSFEGYVKKDCVTAIKGTPNKPFLTNVFFRVYSEQSQNMRKFPTRSGGTEYQEYFLPQDNLNISYIGKIVGDPYVSNRSNLWYYCKFVDSSEHYGYVYAEFCDDGEGNEINIPNNNEEVIYIANPDFNTKEEQPTAIPPESKTTWIVISILSVPAIIFILLFLKSSKFIKKDKKLSNKEVRDY